MRTMAGIKENGLMNAMLNVGIGNNEAQRMKAVANISGFYEDHGKSLMYSKKTKTYTIVVE